MQRMITMHAGPRQTAEHHDNSATMGALKMREWKMQEWKKQER